MNKNNEDWLREHGFDNPAEHGSEDAVWTLKADWNDGVDDDDQYWMSYDLEVSDYAGAEGGLVTARALFTSEHSMGGTMTVEGKCVRCTAEEAVAEAIRRVDVANRAGVPKRDRLWKTLKEYKIMA